MTLPYGGVQQKAGRYPPGFYDYLTYSMTTRRLGSEPVE